MNYKFIIYKKIVQQPDEEKLENFGWYVRMLLIDCVKERVVFENSTKILMTI